MAHVFDLLEQEMAALGIKILPSQLDQLFRFYELLIEKNKVMNLTAITELQDVMIKHFLDSLMIVRIVDFSGIETVVDVGTGAGFPGIPLKILYPDVSFILMDSLGKRIKFIDEVIEDLSLTRIKAIHIRAEDAGRDNMYREKFDVCVSRAVSHLATLAEYCLPLVRCNGCFVSYKSGQIDEEIKTATHAIKVLGGEIDQFNCFVLPGSDINRSLIKINKSKKCPPQYPRKAGLPGKNPL